MTRHTRPILQPGPDHPICVSDQEIDVVVSVRGEPIASAATALELREHTYAPVLYVDRATIDPRFLERSAHTSWCPYKGEARYFHLVPEHGDKLENAVWTYEAPFPAVAAIRNRLGFYPDRVEVTAR